MMLVYLPASIYLLVDLNHGFNRILLPLPYSAVHWRPVIMILNVDFRPILYQLIKNVRARIHVLRVNVDNQVDRSVPI